MAYISVEFAGQKTFGGYLMIDGGRRIPLLDGALIPIDAGTHYLEFSSQSATQRGLANMNAALGNYKTAAYAEANSVDGNITAEFDDNSIMFFTVVSDAKGHILSEPTYRIDNVDEETMLKAARLYSEQCTAQAEAAKSNPDGTIPMVELLLCLFLGSFGAHKFYRKNFGMGMLYLFTMGLFGIGYLIDTVKLIKKVLIKK